MPNDEYFVEKRREMVSIVRSEGISDRSVLEAMLKVPRHVFVPKELEESAYFNRPLPIGFSQTISQPYIVAFMTQEARLTSNSKVLEIGTGSGYQVAILAEIAKEVFSIEVVSPLAKSAAIVLKKLGYKNVYTKVGDGHKGWPEQAPFDVIIVTAAAESLPKTLLAQLAIDGRMLIPVKRGAGVEVLIRVTRISEDNYSTENLLDVRFVPLVKQ